MDEEIVQLLKNINAQLEILNQNIEDINKRLENVEKSVSILSRFR